MPPTNEDANNECSLLASSCPYPPVLSEQTCSCAGRTQFGVRPALTKWAKKGHLHTVCTKPCQEPVQRSTAGSWSGEWV